MNIQRENVFPLLEEKPEPMIQDATVVSVDDNGVVILLSGIEREAEVAVSCLVRPEPEDTVLCAEHKNGLCYILAILQRRGDQKMTVAFPSSVTLKADSGSILMSSRQSVTLAAGEKLACFSEEEIHKGREAVLDFKNITAQSEILRASFQTVHFISRVINTLTSYLMERVKNYVRKTENLDQISAGKMTRKVEGLYTMDSRHTVMISKKDTKIDGERIHMG